MTVSRDRLIQAQFRYTAQRLLDAFIEDELDLSDDGLDYLKQSLEVSRILCDAIEGAIPYSELSLYGADPLCPELRELCR